MNRSEALFERGLQLFPGGVNSPVRAFGAVGGSPIYFAAASGCNLISVDGERHLDFCSSWGASILGHAHPKVTEAISRAASSGASFGACHVGEIRLAEAMMERVPGLEQVRFVNSGTEAALAITRLVRGATGRSKILKFAGCYHGAVDALLAKAGSGVATFGLPDSAGVPASAVGDTLLAPFNSLEAVTQLVADYGDQLAAIVVEPVAGNMGCIPPHCGFLSGLREICDSCGALLVFDEVMTGFRLAPGGAAERFGVKPDLFLFGKVIGGGLPVGAYGGRRDLMQFIAPAGPVYQAGTLSGNPLGMAAGLAVLSMMDAGAYRDLEDRSARLEQILRSLTPRGTCVQRVGSMVSVFFHPGPVENLRTAQSGDAAAFGAWFHRLLKAGVYLPPSHLESWFVTLAHDDAALDRAAEAFESAR